MKSIGKAVGVITENGLLRILADETDLEALLAFAEARPIAGDLEFGRQVIARVSKEISKRFNSNRDALQELHKVVEPFANNAIEWHARTSADLDEVELTIALLRLRRGVNLASESNVAGQITALHESGYLSWDDAHALLQGAGFLRAVDHATRLVTGQAPGDSPEGTLYWEEVGALIRRWGLIGEQDSLDGVLAATQTQIHGLCLRLLKSM
jgi:hypothetical protein